MKNMLNCSMKSTGREGGKKKANIVAHHGTLTAIAALGRNMAAMKPVAANIPAMTSGCAGLGGAPETSRRRGLGPNQSVSSAAAAGWVRIQGEEHQCPRARTRYILESCSSSRCCCPRVDPYARVQLTLRAQDVLYEVTVLIKYVERLKRSGEMVSISWKRGRMFA